MAVNSLRASNADVSVSITGNAGPTPLQDDVGKVYIGCAFGSRQSSQLIAIRAKSGLTVPGLRQYIRAETTRLALRFVYNKLLEWSAAP